MVTDDITLVTRHGAALDFLSINIALENRNWLKLLNILSIMLVSNFFLN